MESNHLLPLKTIWVKIVSMKLDKYVNKLEYATNKTNKYKVTLKNGKTVSFGDKNYEDYLIHKDEKRRENYRNRHKNDNINDPNYSGFWSYHVLW